MALGTVMDVAVMVLAALSAGVGAYLFGGWAIVVAAYAVMIVGAILVPRATALLLLGAIVVIEPLAIDFTKHLRPLLYQWPEGWEQVISFTVSPYEIVLAVIAASLLFRPAPKIANSPGLPLLVWGAPLAVAMGALYGLYKGADYNFVHIEARALVLAMVVFFVARRMRDTPARTMVRLIVVSTAVLAVVLLWRYYTEVRPGDSEVPVAFAFTHQSVLLMGIGAVTGALLILRTDSMNKRLLLAAYVALVLIATFAT